MSRPYLIRLLIWAAMVVGMLALVIQWIAHAGSVIPPAPMVPVTGGRGAMPAGEMVMTDALTYLSGAANVWLGRAGAQWIFGFQILLILALGWGKFGKGLGAYDLIYAESRIVRFGNGLLIGLMFGGILLVQYLTAGEMTPWVSFGSWGLFPVDSANPRSQSPEVLRLLGQHLLVTWLPLLVLFYLPGANTFARDHATLRSWTPALGLGLMLAPLLASGFVVSVWSIGPTGWGDWLAQSPGASAGIIPPSDYPLHKLGFASLLAPLLGLCLCGLLAFAGRVASPIWVIAMIVWLANAIYGLIIFHFTGLQYVLVLLALMLIYVANVQHSYKLCLPNMAPEYAVARIGSTATASLGEATVAPTNALRSPEQFLAEFTANHRRRTGTMTKPKLIVVATSGGGIRAAVWTAALLEGLEARLGDPFRQALGLIGGASGGMVGAGLYAASKVTPVAGESLVHVLAKDSLWALMQTFLIRDLPSLFLPFYRNWDRGFALEATWHRNAPARTPGQHSPWRTTFADLARAERSGYAPVLVYTPLMVEDGRRLVISNLDFSDLTAEYAPTLGTKTRRERLSVNATEFFRLFPEAHARFEVATAARLNATFPFVSPTVCLPATPPRRVVDAGYYDNYGVNLLAAWLYRNRESVREMTSGVAFLEFRAFPLEEEKNGYDGVIADAPVGRPTGMRDRLTSTMRALTSLTATATLRASPPRPSEHAEAGGALVSALAGVSTPAEALLAVRSAGAYFRNDQLLGILDAEFNADTLPGAEPFFVRAAFDCPGEAALSWAISREERDRILGHLHSLDGADTAGIHATVTGLKRWLG